MGPRAARRRRWTHRSPATREKQRWTGNAAPALPFFLKGAVSCPAWMATISVTSIWLLTLDGESPQRTNCMSSDTRTNFRLQEEQERHGVVGGHEARVRVCARALCCKPGPQTYDVLLFPMFTLTITAPA